MQSSSSSSSLLSHVRVLVQQYTSKQLHSTALYWADKAVSLSQGDLGDVAAYVLSLYHCGQYQRAIHTLHTTLALQQSPVFRYLTARCYAACEDWDNVLNTLNPPEDSLPSPSTTPLATPTHPDLPGSIFVSKAPSSKMTSLLQTDAKTTSNTTTSGIESIAKALSMGDIQSASLVLQGEAHEGLWDLPSAMDCYKRALMCDVFCVEALERLCQHHTLTSEEEKSLLEMMPFKSQCSVREQETLKLLYSHKMSHTRKSANLSRLSNDDELRPLATNIDLLCGIADDHFKNMNVDACYELTSDILGRDPYHNPTLLLHVACCVHKKKVEELFSLGHRLVDHFPNSALSWYMVGCYYLAVNKHQSTRKYLTKSVSLEPHFAPAHMAFGLSFAMEGEHDQAISAFSNAARSMKGSHLPLMYLGKEYYLTGIVATSTRFMKSAYDIAPRDPALLQEIGVMMSHSGDFPKAEGFFRQTISRLKAIDPRVTLQAWEPVYNNLGHVMRKQQKFEEALAMHIKALQLEPNHSSTLTAIAFVYLLMGDFDKAVEFCNKSLRLKREDQFTLEVLHTAMEEIAELPLFLDVVKGPIPNLENETETLEDLESGHELRMILRPSEVEGSLGQFTKHEGNTDPEIAMTVE